MTKQFSTEMFKQNKSLYPPGNYSNLKFNLSMALNAPAI